jgi:hypothetical protein
VKQYAAELGFRGVAPQGSWIRSNFYSATFRSRLPSVISAASSGFAEQLTTA